jgi:hypothetical protein
MAMRRSSGELLVANGTTRAGHVTTRAGGAGAGSLKVAGRGGGGRLDGHSLAQLFTLVSKGNGIHLHGSFRDQVRY